MTAKSGPLKPDSDPSGPAWTVSKVVLSVYINGIGAAGAPISYDRSANRISLHGESENAGSGFKAGTFVGLTTLGATVTAAILGLYLADLSSMVVGTGLGVPVALLALLSLAGGIAMLASLLNHLSTMTVIDHTTEPAPETDDLAQQYVDGEIESVDELEAEAEARLE